MKINSLLRLILSTSLVCGLEFCAAIAFTYVPPILLKAGFRESSMSWLMGCGPLMGFLLLPVIGQASDHCRSSFGKRRPFIFGFSIMIFLCLVIIPNVEQISKISTLNILFIHRDFRRSSSCSVDWFSYSRNDLCFIRFFKSGLFESM